MRASRGCPNLLAVLLPLAVGAGVLHGSVHSAEVKNDRLAELTALVKAGKYGEAESGARALLPDVEATNGAESVEAANVLDVLVESLWRGGKAKDPASRELAERTVRIKENALGPDHPDVGKSLSSLGALLMSTGDFAAARQMFERTLAIKEKAFGPDHPEVAKSLSNLGVFLSRTGDHAASRLMYERALAIKEKALGPDHPDVATGLLELANVLAGTGDYAAARPLYERALAIREKALGADHPDVGTSLNNLAVLLLRAGDYAAARSMFERALATREKALGADHPDVAQSLSNLAVLLVNTADYAAARPLLERSIVIREKALGADDPAMAQSLLNLGNVLLSTGEYAAARSVYERVLAITEKALGPDHIDVAAPVNNLGAVHWAVGDYAAARPMYERALAIREKALGVDHPEVASSLENIANVCLKTGDYAAAQPLYERALAIREKALGADHPDVATNLNNLAALLVDTGDYAAARPMYERALAIRAKTLGADHPDLASSVDNLANLLKATGDYAGARPMYERALAIREKSLGRDHPEVAASLNNLGGLLVRTGDYAAARALLERALATKEKALGPTHPELFSTLNNLAELLADTGDYAAARRLYERALAITEAALGPDHPNAALSLNNLAARLGETGDYAAARPMYERALSIRQKALGFDHPDVALSLSNLAGLLATIGDTAGALDNALEAERIGRQHLRLTGGNLSERQALRYAAVRSNSLDLVLTLAVRGLDPASRRRALDALARSRAVVLDEMATRHRTVGGTADPEVARLATELTSTRAQLANLTIRGLGDQKPEDYRKAFETARQEEERAESALAKASAAFTRESSRSRLGLAEVAASLPPASALIAFTEYTRIDLARKAVGTVDSKSSGEKLRSTKDVLSYLAFVLRAGERDPQVVNLGTAQEVDGLVTTWKNEASSGAVRPNPSATSSEASYRAAGAALRQKVWDPLVSALGNAGRVIVVPDGSLNLVNLAALPVEGAGYLIERGPIMHYVSAERDLVPSSKVQRGDALLALGRPSYDATSLFASLRKTTGTAARPSVDKPAARIASGATYRGQHAACRDFSSVRFEPLPATGKETREIVGLWKKQPGDSSPSALELLDAAANETELKRSAPGKRVLHLATHGFFLGGDCRSALDSTRGVGVLVDAPGRPTDPPPQVTGENPLLLSGLALAGANHRSAAGAQEDDGILTAEEIASLDLSGVEWAVLSACETGLGEVRAGEGVFGLRRAFQIAGASTLIMSLWSVDDESTRAWMQVLYEGRLKDHLDTAESVRRASLTILSERREAGLSTHPFHWAAFVAAGDWR